MQPKKDKAYIYGVIWNEGISVLTNNDTITFNLPAKARILNGVSAVIITDDTTIFTDNVYVKIRVNNEILIDDMNLNYLAINQNHFSGFGPLTYPLNIPSNDRQPYHPTPRPLSGSDEVVIELSQLQTLGAMGKLFFHFHYQPIQ